jgi:hypothetical protein
MTENEKNKAGTANEPSLLSGSQLGGSESDSEDYNNINNYVTEFKKEVERKFTCSKVNSKYRFPRKTIQNRQVETEREYSYESLNNVTFYDLDSQNVKQQLTDPLNSNRVSETDFLVNVIKRLGNLDHRYLKSQMGNNRSPFFKILYSSIQRKVSKDRKSIESLKSASIKTKSITIPKKSSQLKPVVKNSDLTTFQKNYITTGYHHLHNMSNQLPNVQAFASTLGGAKSKPDFHLPMRLPVRKNHSSASPRSNLSHASFKSKVNKKSESTKLQGELRKNFSGNPCLKTSINKSSSNTNHNSKSFGGHNLNSVFNIVKNNILSSNKNISQTAIGKPKSKSKEAPKVAPLVLPNSNSSKNQISLTKDQLRSLIQKSIYKKTPQEIVAVKFVPSDKSLSRSSKKPKEKQGVNIYEQPVNTSTTKPLQRKEHSKKVISSNS